MPDQVHSLIHWLQIQGAEYALRILGSIAIILIGFWLAKLVSQMIRRLLVAQKVDAMLVSFIGNLARGLLIAFVVVAAIQNLGVQTASFIAVIGAASLAISMALQGSLGNFASGVIMIILRPFKVGDYIEAGGTAGIVEEIDIFATVLHSPDNKRVIVPNGKITNDVIVNYSSLDTRRIDFTFGCSYKDDIPQVKSVLANIAASDNRVLPDPPPQVLVSELGESSVNLILRVWVKKEDYWPLHFDTIEAVKLAFDRAGISIPYPQRDIHLFQQPG